MTYVGGARARWSRYIAAVVICFVVFLVGLPFRGLAVFCRWCFPGWGWLAVPLYYLPAFSDMAYIWSQRPVTEGQRTNNAAQRKV